MIKQAKETQDKRNKEFYRRRVIVYTYEGSSRQKGAVMDYISVSQARQGIDSNDEGVERGAGWMRLTFPRLRVLGYLLELWSDNGIIDNHAVKPEATLGGVG